MLTGEQTSRSDTGRDGAGALAEFKFFVGATGRDEWGVRRYKSVSRGAGKSIGEQLRQARKARKKTLAEISEEICIRERHLKALEDDNFDALPAPAYALCFLRAFAKSVDLNPDDLVDSFKEGNAVPNGGPELVFPEPIPQSRVPSLSVMAVAAAVMVGIYFGWVYEPGTTSAQSTAVPPVPERLLTPTQETASAPPETVMVAGVDETTGDKNAPEPAQPASSDSDSTEAYVPASGTDVTPEPVEEKAEQSVEQGPAEIESDAEVAVSQGVPDALGKQAIANAFAVESSRIRLKARADTWIRITGGTNVIYDGVLRRGQEFVPPALDGLELTTGNAGGLQVFVDGETVKSLGKSGAVVRRVRLDPERLKRGTAVASR